jgi:hypothetical protein
MLLQGPVLPLQSALLEQLLWDPPAQVPFVLTPHWLLVVQAMELSLEQTPLLMVPAAQFASEVQVMLEPPLVVLEQVPLALMYEGQSLLELQLVVP